LNPKDPGSVSAWYGGRTETQPWVGAIEYQSHTLHLFTVLFIWH